jgi:succinate dehydrogenase / fumarate reductase cytochrome b subunit
VPESTSVVGEPAGTTHFLLRKLHSLSGVVPIGTFLIVHLLTNASVLAGARTFQSRVDMIHALRPFLVPVEFAFIFVPIGFHAALGVKIWWTSKSNVRLYPEWANFRYTVQRVTGIVALVFIVFHIWHMHWLGHPLGGGWFVPEDAAYTAGAAIQRHEWIWMLYAVGILAAVYHFANGLWTFLISWGITIGEKAQRKAGYICAVIGITLGGVGLGALWSFERTPLDELQLHQSPKTVVTEVEAESHG